MIIAFDAILREQRGEYTEETCVKSTIPQKTVVLGSRIPAIIMKTLHQLTVLALGALLTFHASAGTVFYVPIPPAQSDTNSGIDASLHYTSAIDAGNSKEATRVVNGVTFHSLRGSGNTATVNDVTLSAATGSLINGGGKTESIQADGALSDVFGSMIFNDGAEDNSEQYVVLEPSSLTAGKTYDLRVYMCNSSGQNREVNLSFVGDGNTAVSTDFFNQDDATTSAGGFAERNQVYYITYRYKWDGVSSPGITITQRFGSIPFCLYALTNHEVAGGDTAGRPAGAVLATHAVATAATPLTRTRKRNLVVSAEAEDVGVASEVFYDADSLRSNGRWVEVGEYGRCWQPSHVDVGWSPYTRGRWVHSDDDGWIWDSDEDWGWATYHYGRWFREEDAGWCWVPGRVWAPSWVSWRYGSSYVGWAPLPPVAIATVGIGIGGWADVQFGIGPLAYSFVNVRDFGAPSLGSVIIPQDQNVNIVKNTTNITNITNIVNNRTTVNNGNVIYNGGPNINAVNNIIKKTGGQQVQTVRLDPKLAAKPLTPDGKFSQLQGGVLAVAAPKVVPTKGKLSLPKTNGPPIKKPKIDQGWSGVSDPGVKSSLTSKMAGELPSRTAKNAPARMPGTLPAKPSTISKPAVAGLKKPGIAGKVLGEPAVVPGQPVGPKVRGVKKPGLPVKPPGEVVAPPERPGGSKVPGVKKPGLPARPPGEAVVQPEQPVKPKMPRVKKPGISVTPPDESAVQPEQPVKPKGTRLKKPLTPANSGEPTVQPVKPTTPSGKKPGKLKKPADEPIQSPNQPATHPDLAPVPKPSPKQRGESEARPKQQGSQPGDSIPKPTRLRNPPPEKVQKPVEPVNRARPVQSVTPGSKPPQPAAPVIKRPVQPPPSQPPAGRPPNESPQSPQGDKPRKPKPTSPPD